MSSLGNWFDSYEILIINDGSTDSTHQVADRLAHQHNCIKVIDHSVNQGLGSSLRHGYESAEKDYVMWYCGDNSTELESIKDALNRIGSAEILVPYISNPRCRSWTRRIISKMYTASLNFIFGLKLRYYNASVIYRTEQAKKFLPRSKGFAALAETLIYSIKEGHSYVEIPQFHRHRQGGNSKAFLPKNFIDVFLMLTRVFWNINLKS